MKRFYIFAAALCGALLIACGGTNTNSGDAASSDNTSNGNGVAFNPQHRESKYSESEREALIAQKRAELNIDIEALLEQNPIRLFIIRPAVTDDVEQSHADMVGRQLLAMAAHNGVAADGANPIFVLGGNLDCIDIELTSTTPQKYVAKYNLEILIGNAITGDRYASTTLSLVGAGDTKRDAVTMAMQQIENSNAIQKMFADANTKIVEWYETNLPTIKRDVALLSGGDEYEMAVMLLSSVPQQATTCFAYAEEVLPALMVKAREARAAENLASMKTHIAASPDKFDETVAAYYKLIPADNALYAEATTVFNDYVSSLSAQAAAAGEYAAKQAAIEAKWQRDYAMMTLKANAKVEMAKARSNGGKSSSIFGNGFLGLGKLFDNASDLINRYWDEKF